MLKSMEAQDKSGLQLTDEQNAEVERRMARKDVTTIPFEDIFERFHSPRMKIRFEAEADADFDRVFKWIAKDNLAAAYAMIERSRAA